MELRSLGKELAMWGGVGLRVDAVFSEYSEARHARRLGALLRGAAASVAVLHIASRLWINAGALVGPLLRWGGGAACSGGGVNEGHSWGSRMCAGCAGELVARCSCCLRLANRRTLNLPSSDWDLSGYSESGKSEIGGQ